VNIFKNATAIACLAAAGQLWAADPPTPVTVAAGRNGQTAWEFIGTIKQNGADMTMTGYITAIAGLQEGQLFNDATTRSDTTARFKFSATGKMTARHVLAPLFVLSAVSTSNYTFNSGTLLGSSSTIATTNATLQTVVDVISPGRGLFQLSGEIVRTTADNFTLDGVTYRFGEPNRVMRINMTGDGTLSDPAGPVSTILVAGRVVMGDYLPQQ
jgi:hypothetical protein